MEIKVKQSNGSCFYCSDDGHWKNACPWVGYPCVHRCGLDMAIFWSTQPHSKDCRFLSCKGSPKCKGFKWIDQPPTSMKKEEKEKEGSSTEGTIKLSIGGKLPMIVEGSTSDISELIKKLQI
ncbi:hypothetical protein ACHQM5_021000 [Ranunculus cassubicifolius]